jgi:hypothetical protein
MVIQEFRQPATGWSLLLAIAAFAALAQVSVARADADPDIIFRNGFDPLPTNAAIFPDPGYTGNGVTTKVGPDGLVHLLYNGSSGGTDASVRYGECAHDCTQVGNWRFITLGSYGTAGLGGGARLLLDAAGHPHVMWYAQSEVGGDGAYDYGQCSGDCTATASWNIAEIGRFTGGDTAFPLATSAFALDALGRPRFVFQDTANGVQYAWCDDDCAVAANWYAAQLPGVAADAALAFDGSRPRMLFEANDANVVNGEDLYYAACDGDCSQSGNWQVTALVNVNPNLDGLPFALALDDTGAPRTVFSSSGRLAFAGCDSDCTQADSWLGALVGLQQQAMRPGVALVLDASGAPVIAYGNASSAAGDETMALASCVSDCGTAAPTWQSSTVESYQDIIEPAPDPCMTGQSYWQLGPEPTLALDAAGTRHLAYDVYFVADCPDGVGGYYLYSGDGPVRYAER